MKQEERITQANYIINFYNEVALLTNLYAEYKNILILIDSKYGGAIEKIEETDRNYMFDIVQQIRAGINKINIYSNCFQDKEIVPKADNTKLIKEVNDDLIIKSETVEKLTIFYNQILINNIMKDLLKSSQDILNNIYNDGTN